LNLAVLSYKVCWYSPDDGRYRTAGGFPFQMAALSRLFDRTTLIILERRGPLPAGLTPLKGHNLEVIPLAEPPGSDLRRKIALLTWLPRHLPRLWDAVRQADAVHALVPGDVGTLGTLVALAQGKRLFVRHCGTWGNRTTLADRFLHRLLERLAGGKRVVMATGGGSASPSLRNPAIRWIGATTLSEAELAALPEPACWSPGEPLRLITVGRLSSGKNTAASVRALRRVRNYVPAVSLDVVGDGPERKRLEVLTDKEGLSPVINFHGNVSHAEVLRLLGRGHLFLFPTQVKEGFPKAVLEAMACGLPVLASRVSVLPRLLGNGGGILLSETNEGVLAEGILRLVADPEQMRNMGRKARETARSFSLEEWQAVIFRRLTDAWGPLRRFEGKVQDNPQPLPSPGFPVPGKVRS
jgi:glycosyltransferase involved in cell wall biosynthesis